jgi:hypothetical protein
VSARTTDASAVHGDKSVDTVGAAVADPETIVDVIGVDTIAGCADAVAGAYSVRENAGVEAVARALAIHGGVAIDARADITVTGTIHHRIGVNAGSSPASEAAAILGAVSGNATAARVAGAVRVYDVDRVDAVTRAKGSGAAILDIDAENRRAPTFARDAITHQTGRDS